MLFFLSERFAGRSRYFSAFVFPTESGTVQQTTPVKESLRVSPNSDAPNRYSRNVRPPGAGSARFRREGGLRGERVRFGVAAVRKRSAAYGHRPGLGNVAVLDIVKHVRAAVCVMNSIRT